MKRNDEILKRDLAQVDKRMFIFHLLLGLAFGSSGPGPLNRTDTRSA